MDCPNGDLWPSGCFKGGGDKILVDDLSIVRVGFCKDEQHDEEVKRVLVWIVLVVGMCSAGGQEELPPVLVEGKQIGKAEANGVVLQGEALVREGFVERDSFLAAAGGFVGNGISGNYSLRGWNNDDLFGLSGGTNAGGLIVSTIGGVPVSTMTARFFPRLLGDLSEVHVMRGGQAMYEGSVAQGGVIAYVDALPDFDWTGRVGLEAGERGFFRSRITQNVTLKERELALRLHYEHLEGDGSLENVILDDDEFARSWRDYAKAQLLWRPERGRTQVLASLEHDKVWLNPTAGSKAFAGFGRDDRKTDANTRESFPAERWLGSLALDHETDGGVRIHSVVGVASLNADGLIDLDGGNVLRGELESLIEETHFTYGLSLEGELSESSTWKVGTFHGLSDYEQEWGGVDGTGIPFATSGDEEVRIHSLRGMLDWQMTGQWRVEAGLRLNYVKTEVESQAAVGPFPFVRSRLDQVETAFLPSLMLEWEDGEAWGAGVKLLRSFRRGGVSYAPLLGVTQEHDAQYGNEAEIFVSYEGADDWQVTGRAFFADIQEIQVPVLVPGGVLGVDGLIENAGQARQYGMEWQANWSPGEDWRLDAVATFTKTEFSELVLNGVDRSGSSFPNAPEFTASLGIGYQPESGVFGNVRVSWSDVAFTEVSEPRITELESRWDVSARLGYRGEDWEVYLFGTNLLGEDYALGVVDARGIGGGVISRLNEPRMLGLGFSRKW